jgi:hypothetical protein
MYLVTVRTYEKMRGYLSVKGKLLFLGIKCASPLFHIYFNLLLRPSTNAVTIKKVLHINIVPHET